jgi:phage shock protein A
VSTLTKTEHNLEGKLSNLQAQVAKLDAQVVAAKAMKEASASLGDGDATLAENLDNLERKVADLSADVEAELQGEEERFRIASDNVAGANKAVSEVDAFIQDVHKPTDRVAEINHILGGKK